MADVDEVGHYPRKVSISGASDRVGQVLGGRYRLLAPIGTGASATVYLADDVVLRRRVAVKVLHDALSGDISFLKRFRAEAQAAAAMNHPHIVAVHDWGQGDVPYLVTELVAGGSLRAVLDAGTRLDLAQAQRLALEASSALEYAHRRGFVHRDIKPANLLLDEEGRLRIADFGIARALAEAAWTEPSGAMLGTARYASPEQVDGSTLDGRSDVYSLGLVIIEAVTGEVPFAADTTLGTLMARVDRPVPVPAELGPLRPSLMLAGATRAVDRPDAEQFSALLRAAGDCGPLTALSLTGIAVADAGSGTTRDATDIFIPESALTGHGPDDDITIIAAPVSAGAGTVDRPATRTFERGDEGGGRNASLLGETGALGTGSPGTGRRRWMRRPLVLGVVVGLVVAAVAVALLVNRTPTFTLADWTSVPVAEARAALEADGARVVEVGAFSETLARDLVIAQDPVAGTTVSRGDVVTLTVSLGPPPVPVPTDLAGMTVEEATATLEAAGLRLGPLVDDYDEEIAPGIVLGPAEGVGPEAPKGSEVSLRVSIGPRPRIVPEGLVGRPVAEVTTALQELGLVVARNDAYSESVPEGQVLSVTPGAGTEVPKGSTVTVSASRGKRPVTIPGSIIGRTVAEATAILEDLGLEVSGVDGRPTGLVTGATPAVGTEVRPGSAVRLRTN